MTTSKPKLIGWGYEGDEISDTEPHMGNLVHAQRRVHEACDYGVNPRFLLAMARVATLKGQADLSERRRNGVTRYHDTSRDVAALSRLQLEAAVLERLGQGAASVSGPSEPPDFVFYTGCNVLKTPHIALLALDIMDALGISYQVMGRLSGWAA